MVNQVLLFIKKKGSTEAKKTEGATNVPTIAFQENIIPTNISELFMLAPFLIFRFLFAPFPWELSNLKYLFAFLDSSLMLLLFINLQFFKEILK